MATEPGVEPGAGRPAAEGPGGLRLPPVWLQRLGTSAWLIAGIALVTVAAVWLLSLTDTIVMPVVTAGVIAAVASPIVAWLARHRVPRLVGAALVVLLITAIAVGTVVLVIGGILGETDTISRLLTSAKNTLGNWAHDLGVNQNEVQDAKDSATKAVKNAVPALLHGVIGGITKLSSLVFFLALTALSLIFLLKDGPLIRSWAEQHAGVPAPAARIVTGRLLQSMRGYFVGVTAVALFNAVVIGLGALLFGVPLAGTIAIVNFLAAYIPYLGAWSAGAFTVLLALGGAGTDAAIAMAVICLLANGILQQLVQPVAYGAALGIHPLAVLIVTIAGGSLFGTVGLVLAAPLTSAVTRIAGDLSAARRPIEPEAGLHEPAPG
jgi:predicted PurR-regulated permease PerM